MNIIIPMAGNGQRFIDAGYQLPKPMIDVLGQPMIARVLENLDIDGQYHFIVKSEHQKKYQICDVLKQLVPDCIITQLHEHTQGAVCSVLEAFKNKINFNEELVITNCDQIFEWNKKNFFDIAASSEGVLLCHRDNDSKWSYCIGEEVDDMYMNVTSVVEKPTLVPDHSYANVGLYYWKETERFYTDAQRMINNKCLVKGEYYISPLYNYLCEEEKSVRAVMCKEMNGIGTPEDLKKYECKFDLDNKN